MGIIYKEQYNIPNSSRSNSASFSSNQTTRSSITSIYTTRSSFSTVSPNSSFSYHQNDTRKPLFSNFHNIQTSNNVIYDDDEEDEEEEQEDIEDENGDNDDNDSLTETQIKILRCQDCHTHICLSSLIISDNFYGNHGAAYFVDNVLNIKLHSDQEFKRMRTGRYGVKSLYCVQCDKDLGWKYVYSEEESEKYKEGKYVIEKNLLEQVDI